MAKIELTRRRILGGLVTIGAGSAAAGAGTFALFSDTESDTSSISAGALDLQTGSSDGVQFTASDIVPTETGGGSVELDKSSTGSIAADLTVRVTSVTSNESGDSNGEGELDDQLELNLWLDADNDGSLNNSDIVLNADGSGSTSTGSSAKFQTASNYDGAEWTDVITDFSGPVTFYVDWEFPDLSDNNDAQGDDIQIEFEFELVQQTQ